MLSAKKHSFIFLLLFSFCFVFVAQYVFAFAWMNPVLISLNCSYDSFLPSIGVGPDGAIHITWEDMGTGYGTYGVFYKCKKPGEDWKDYYETVSWIPTDSITPSVGALAPDLIVTSDGRVYIGYEDATDYGDAGNDPDIFLKVRLDTYMGPYWAGPMIVSRESEGGSTNPSLASGPDGTVHIAWKEGRSIYYKFYVFNVGFSEAELVTTESSQSPSYPTLDVGVDGVVHIAWHDRIDYNGSGGDWDIFYKKYIPGTGWTTTEVVSTESTGDSMSPSLAISSAGVVHIAWQDQTNYNGSGGDWDIFYKKYIPGTDWTTTEVVSTESTGDSMNPSLDVGDDGRAHVAWSDFTNYDVSGSDQDIFYKSHSSGNSWLATEVVSIQSTNDSRRPSLVFENRRGGTVHITWEDNSDVYGADSDYDIFYRVLYLTGVWRWTPWGYILMFVVFVVAALSFAYFLARKKRLARLKNQRP